MESSSSEKSLLAASGHGEEEEEEEEDGVVAELRKLSYIACPMMAVNLSMYFLQVISIMMVGHLGELYLSSTAIAVSFCSVTGFSLAVSFYLFFTLFEHG